MISSVRLENIIRKYPSAGYRLCIPELVFSNFNIYVIAGANASGKTTLLKTIAFLEVPDKGRIFFDEMDVFAEKNNCKSLRKRVGFVMQNPYLFDMDVFGNIALGLKIRKYSEKEIIFRVTNILENLQIEHLSHRNVRELSAGERQKVAIAQVLVLNPDVILLDEPTANVDMQSTLAIEKIIRNIQKTSNPIIIMTTHSLSQTYRISTNIIYLAEGKIAESLDGGFNDNF